MFHGHRSITKPDGSMADAWFTYTCGHCETKVSGAVVAHEHVARWLACTSCGKPSSSFGDKIFPGVKRGHQVSGLPSQVEAVYNEARECMAVGAYTGVELLCRKILMNVAVEKGAKAGESFASYLGYLEAQAFITPGMRTNWLDLVREHGNMAAHEIEKPEKSRAEATLIFTAELLRVVYEMDFYAKQFKK